MKRFLHSQRCQVNCRSRPEEQELLQEIIAADFLYFWEQANPETGVVKDRCNVITQEKTPLGSIAALGFGLTAICIGEMRGLVSYNEARGRVSDVAPLYLEEASESSRIFLPLGQCGYRRAAVGFRNIFRGHCYSALRDSDLPPALRHSEIRNSLVIFDRVDWTWLSEDTRILPHGWSPESGFLQYRWDDYSEMMMMYLLGLGSTAHPLPAETWNAWKRPRLNTTVSAMSAPLRRFSFISILRLGLIFAENTITMQIISRIRSSPRTSIAGSAWICQSSFPTIATTSGALRLPIRRKVMWFGAALRRRDPLTEPLFRARRVDRFRFFHRRRCACFERSKIIWERAWSRYGFVDAFNPLTNWYDTDVVGIDTGITMLMAENARTGFVWDTFMKNPEARRGMQRPGSRVGDVIRGQTSACATCDSQLAAAKIYLSADRRSSPVPS